MNYDYKNYNYIDIVRCYTTPDKLSRIGRLLINNVPYCYTLEPMAYLIPVGCYDLTLQVVSPRFAHLEPYKSICCGKVPRLLNVSGRDGILIHIGNFPTDSRGCILVGEYEDSKLRRNRLISSRATFIRLYNKIKTFKFPIKVVIRDVRETIVH